MVEAGAEGVELLGVAVVRRPALPAALQVSHSAVSPGEGGETSHLTPPGPGGGRGGMG